MKLRYLICLLVVFFLAALLVSASLVQAQTRVLTETRRSALAIGVSRDEFYGHDVFRTAEALYVLKTIDALDAVNVTQGLSMLFSTQSMVVGNQTLWGWPSKVYNQSYVVELFEPYMVISTLKLLGVVDQLNRTALIDMVMQRYNASEGAFHEPITMIDMWHGEDQWAGCFFRLIFPQSTIDMAYADSNMVSTFLAVSILDDLDALSMINVTKTMEWVLSCRAENGGFKPFPWAYPDYLPGWSRFKTNYFHVDGYGTGIAYTYAAIGALKALGVNVSDVVDTQKVKDYVLACNDTYPGDTIKFRGFPDDSTPYDYYSYYAIMTLYYIGALEQEVEVTSKVVSYYLKWFQDLNLGFNSTWPIPSEARPYYGTFTAQEYWAVSAINVTGNLHVLDQPTPRAWKAWLNLMVLSVITGAVTTGILMSVLQIRKLRSKSVKTASPVEDR